MREKRQELLYLVLNYTTHWKPSLILKAILYKEPTNIKILIGYRQLSKEKSIKHWVSF